MGREVRSEEYWSYIPGSTQLEPQPKGAGAALAGEPSVLLGAAHVRCCCLPPALVSMGLLLSWPAAMGPHLPYPSLCPQP